MGFLWTGRQAREDKAKLMANQKKIYGLLVAGAVIVVALAAVLVLTSCTQQTQLTTATPARTPSPSPQSPAPAPISTATALAAAPGPSSTLAPAPAVTAAAPGTKSTAAPAARCPVSPVRAFGKVYSENPNVARALGCAQQPEKGVYMAEQPFQKGFMYWRSDTRQIYAIMDNGRWGVFPDTWNEGDPSPNVGAPAPSGATEPVRGFGKVWREQSGVRDGLGWGTAPERGFDGVIEPFANGAMLWSDKRIIFVLVSDGTWLRFADAS